MKKRVCIFLCIFLSFLECLKCAQLASELFGTTDPKVTGFSENTSGCQLGTKNRMIIDKMATIISDSLKKFLNGNNICKMKPCEQRKDWEYSKVREIIREVNPPEETEGEEKGKMKGKEQEKKPVAGDKERGKRAGVGTCECDCGTGRSVCEDLVVVLKA